MSAKTTHKKSGTKADASVTQEETKREVRAKHQDLREQLQRLQAEFENYQKRVEKEREERAQYAAGAFIAKLLPLLDSFELALKNAVEKDAFYQGIEMIYAQLKSLLEDNGVTEIGAGSFNPVLHEAMLTEASKEPKGTILDVLQKGYKLKDRVLRTAKVKIAK